MKAGCVLTLFLGLYAGQAFAQQLNTSIGPTNGASASFDAAVTPYLNTDLQAQRSEFQLGKGVRVHGPIIHLFHTKKVGEIPKRFWHLINPFSRSESAPETEIVHARDLSPRAWSTVVGWHPGHPVFAEPLTHEGGLGLVTIDR